MKAGGIREKLRLRESGNLVKKGRYVIRRLVRNVRCQALGNSPYLKNTDKNSAYILSQTRFRKETIREASRPQGMMESRANSQRETNELVVGTDIISQQRGPAKLSGT